MDQQAPSVAWHSCPVEVQRLSTKAHFTRDGTVFQRSSRISRVRMELNIPLKRFALAQPITPTWLAGGLISFSVRSGGG
jgi:hypothetical protein